MSNHQCGLIDLVIGLYASVFGLGMAIDRMWDASFAAIMPAILMAIALLIWIQAKRKITMPRIGYVRFGTKGTNKLFAILGA